MKKEEEISMEGMRNRMGRWRWRRWKEKEDLFF